MTNLFLKARHWQLFAVMVGPVIILSFFDMLGINITSDIDSQSLLFDIRIIMIFPHLLPFTLIFFLGWVISVVFGFRKKLPPGMSIRMWIFIPAILYLTIIFASIVAWSARLTNGVPVPFNLLGYRMAAFLLALIGMGFQLYLFIVAARIVKTLEIGRVAKFSDYAEFLVLTYFYPLGVWFLQPMINKLVNQE